MQNGTHLACRTTTQISAAPSLFLLFLCVSVRVLLSFIFFFLLRKTFLLLLLLLFSFSLFFLFSTLSHRSPLPLFFFIILYQPPHVKKFIFFNPKIYLNIISYFSLETKLHIMFLGDNKCYLYYLESDYGQ